jgi:hypothetical protein
VKCDDGNVMNSLMEADVKDRDRGFLFFHWAKIITDQVHCRRARLGALGGLVIR